MYRNPRSRLDAFNELIILFVRRIKTESCTSVCKKLSGNDRPCKTCDRSFWGSIRGNKLWSSLQNSCQNFIKSATASIGQMVKRTSRVIRSKKCTRESYAKKPSQFNSYPQRNDRTECLHDTTCWEEIMLDETENCEMPCCQNICYSFNENSTSAELTECQQCTYRGYR